MVFRLHLGFLDLVVHVEADQIAVYLVFLDIDILGCADDFEGCLLADHVPSPYPSLVPYVRVSIGYTPLRVAFLLLKILVV